MTHYNRIIHIEKDELISLLERFSSKSQIIFNLLNHNANISYTHALEYVVSKFDLKFEDFGIKDRSTKIPITDRVNSVINNNNGKKLKSSKHLIGLLIKEGTLEYKCYGENCSIKNTWNDRPISLQLEHINGNSTDHSRDNLTLLCPNCHSQTDTYALGHQRLKSKHEKEISPKK